MKKGVIIEIKNNQKVVLADNGRFYVSSLKKGDIIGARVNAGVHKRAIGTVAIAFLIAAVSFMGGIAFFSAARAGTPETLVRLNSYPEAHSAEFEDYSAEFILSASGRVLSAAPLSAAAAIILSGIDYEKQPIESVAVEFLDISLRCGFYDVSKGGVLLINSYNIAVGDAENTDHRIYKSVRGFAAQKGIKLLAVKGLPRHWGVVNCPTRFELAVLTAASIVTKNEEIRSAVLKKQQPITFEHSVDSVSRLKTSEQLNIIKLAHERYHRVLGEQRLRSIVEKQQSLITGNRQRMENYLGFNNFSQYEQWESEKGVSWQQMLSTLAAKEFTPPHYLLENAD